MLKVLTIFATGLLATLLTDVKSVFPAQSYDLDKNLPAMAIPIADRGTETHDSIIRLHDDKDGSFFCSGFVVSDNYAITAGHCIDTSIGFGMGGMRKAIIIRDSNLVLTGVIAKGVAINRRGDTGLIKGDFRLFRKLKFPLTPQEDYENLKTSTPFLGCGYPYGDNLYCGPVAPAGIENFHLAGRGMLYPGMSGGPLINKETNTVIGINSYVNGQVVAFSSVMGILASFGGLPVVRVP